MRTAVDIRVKEKASPPERPGGYRFPFDAQKYGYPSRRNVVYGRNGMVATSNPLAAQAGLEILKKGGSAVDAIIAASAALTVVEPSSNGIGGDAFAMVWSGGKLHGLNASGPSPASITAEKVRARGFREVPETGCIPITVPGVPAAWAELSKKFGKLPLEQVLEPAALYAEEGYVLQPCVAREWSKCVQRFETLRQELPVVESWFETFAPGGRTVKAGDIITLRDHAATLREIGRTGAESFYRGGLARKIAGFVRANDGFLSEGDMADYHPEWVTPLSVRYKGYDVFEMPPNGQGITVLMALNILKGLPDYPCDSFESVHQQIEALKLAFCDVKRYVADPKAMGTAVEDLLSERYAALRGALIGAEALMPEAGRPSGGDTVYLCAADREGNMVSYIQSNYMNFGSGVVVPGTGVALQNRGCNFSLDPDSDNVLAPSKRPYHTIIPGFLCKDGAPVGPFGVMGGFIQPQAHLQVLVNTIDYHMNPQEALDRPRWCWLGEKTIEVEQSFDPCLVGQLVRAGHEVVVKAENTIFGRGEIIWRDGDGILCGGCEPRTDGMVAVW